MIGRYYAKDGNGKIGYLLDCKLLPSRCGNLLSNDLSVFYQQGTFYPVTFDSLNNLYLNGVPYYERLQAMKLR